MVINAPHVKHLFIFTKILVIVHVLFHFMDIPRSSPVLNNALRPLCNMSSQEARASKNVLKEWYFMMKCIAKTYVQKVITKVLMKISVLVNVRKNIKLLNNQGNVYFVIKTARHVTEFRILNALVVIVEVIY